MSINAQRSNVIELHNADGSISRYKRFSSRLPEYLESYPPSGGWRIERSTNHAMSACPDLVKLHMAAVSVGKSPKDLGLPPLPTGMIYECRLVDPNGTAVMSATCLVPARESHDGAATAGNKDWEAGETNAFQRLVASLGFSGDVLDEDETTRQQQLGRSVDKTKSPIADVRAVEGEIDESSSKPAVVRTKVSPTPRDQASHPRAARAPQDADLLKGLQRQIDMLARQKKQEARTAKSVIEAKEILASLMDSSGATP